MAWYVEYNPDYGIIECRAEGFLTAKEIKEASEKTIALSGENDTKLILIDDSQVEETIETLEIYELPRYYEEINVDRKVKVAVILPNVPKAREDVLFFETVCRNRGWNIHTFTKRKEALEWLTDKASTEKPDADN